MDLSIIFNILFGEDDMSDDFIHLRRERHIRIDQYYERVLCNYSLSDFKSHFRLSKSTFETLLHKIGPFLLRRNGNPKIQPCKQLAVTLWILGNQEVYRSVADRFNMSKDIVWKCVFNVSHVLENHINEYIKWPTNGQLMRNATKFEEISNFPGVVGVIDGCHISISAPTEHPNSYINRKGFYSVILQGVCDYNMKFIDIFAGYCGSVHDARVWQLSDLKHLIDNNREQYCPGYLHLLGDSAYPLSRVLLTPYKDNGHLSELQINYNKKLSSTRIIIERAFGLLKCRFRKLNYIYMFNVDMVPLIILACCVLHNICIDNEDEISDNEQHINGENNNDDDFNDYDENIFTNSEEKRNIIANLIN
ncbi:putative nuclease HARBI1 [Prorops nasuta]|uniref:putative nuclease HARBI1 n=1 Tax=Prorops nasuta TaxID=863751 RepID=UPI0034CF29EC